MSLIVVALLALFLAGDWWHHGSARGGLHAPIRFGRWLGHGSGAAAGTAVFTAHGAADRVVHEPKSQATVPEVQASERRYDLYARRFETQVATRRSRESLQRGVRGSKTFLNSTRSPTRRLDGHSDIIKTMALSIELL